MAKKTKTNRIVYVFAANLILYILTWSLEPEQKVASTFMMVHAQPKLYVNLYTHEGMPLWVDYTLFHSSQGNSWSKHLNWKETAI